MAGFLRRWRIGAAGAAALLLAAAPAGPGSYDLGGHAWGFPDAKVKVGGHAKWFSKTLHMSMTVPGTGSVQLNDDGTWLLTTGSTHVAGGTWAADPPQDGKNVVLSLDAQGEQDLEAWVADLVFDLTNQYAKVTIDCTLTSVDKVKATMKAKVDKKHGQVRVKAKAAFTLSGTSDSGDSPAKPCVVHYKLKGLSNPLPLSAVTR